MEEQQVIESAGLLKKAAELLTKGLSKLFNDVTSESKPIEKEGKVGNRYKFWLEDHPAGAIYADIFPVQGKEDTYYLDKIEFSGKDSDGNADHTFHWTGKLVDGDKIIETINGAINDDGNQLGNVGRPDEEPQSGEQFETNESDAQAATAATRIYAQLIKIAASDDIELTAVHTDYSPKDTLDILSDIVSDDTFVSQLSEDPTAVEIIETPNDYEVNLINSVDTSNTFMKLFDEAVGYLTNLYTVKWTCADSEFQSSANELLWVAQTMVEELAKLCIRENQTYPNAAHCEYEAVSVEGPATKHDALSTLLMLTSKMVDVLDLYYVNVEHDVQYTFDQWMRDLKNYSEVTIVSKLAE